MPGVAGLETIKYNHNLMLDERAQSGILASNPVYEDLLEAALCRKFQLGGHKAYAIAKALARGMVCLVSGLDSDQVRRLGFVPVNSLDQALALVYRDSKNINLPTSCLRVRLPYRFTSKFKSRFFTTAYLSVAEQLKEWRI